MLSYAIKASGVLPDIIHTPPINVTQVLAKAYAIGHFSQFYNHLSYVWFLYYLLMIHFVTAIILAIYDFCYGKFNLSVHFALFNLFLDSILSSFYKPFILAIPFAGLIMVSPHWYVVTPNSFTPNIIILAIYGYCYWIGWLIYRQQPITSWQKDFGWHYLALQLGIFLPVYYLFEPYQHNFYSGLAYYGLKLICCYCYSGGTWLSISCLFSLSKRYFNKPNTIGRYLAGASYWLYLVQIPVIVYLQIYFLPSQVEIFCKIMSIYFITLALALLLYQFLIRHTFIG